MDAQQRRCGACRISLPAFDRARSFGVYDGNLRRLIHLLKYDKMRPLAKPLAEYMGPAAGDFEPIDFCVPVPLNCWRLWRRGFNQAELLARRVASLRGLPCRPRVLRRVRRTDSQAGLSNQQRRSNVGGAFAVRRGAAVRGARVLLVDDVMTTGATLDACARVLKRAGVEYVGAVTIARAKRRIIEVNTQQGVAPQDARDAKR